MKKLNKRIAIISGSRGDYDLLKPIIKRMYSAKNIKVQSIITGSHLIKNYKNNRLFSKDKIIINKKISIKYLKDDTTSILNYLADGIKKFNKCFLSLKPDLILILGDRYEIFSAAISAHFNRIPIAHISGGEITVGSFDDAIRHSITKLSSLHFVTNNVYFNRVKQLGEASNKVFCVGSTGVEDISTAKLLKKKDIEKKINFKLKKRNFIVTYHPVTFEKDYGINDFRVLLKYLSSINETGIIFTLPNIDTNNYQIIRLIKRFVKKNSNSVYFKYLGKEVYFSLIKNVDGVIGNSSSGIAEVPSFKKPTINIGIRQKGRVRALSIIDINKINYKKIHQAFKKIGSISFKKKLFKTKNPYYKKDSSKNIVRILEKINLNGVTTKEFVDLN